LGLRLKNTSGLRLLQGPVTVFEGSSYAGDARVADLQPGEERLLSYAVDLGTEVKPEVAADSGRLTHLKSIKGVLYTTIRLRETKTYTVKNRNPQGRAVLIGHPVKDQFQLVDTTMLVQTARDAYRFEVQVPAGNAAAQTVTEERDVGSAVQLTDSPDERVRVFLQSPVVSEKVKEGLRKAQGLRRKWARAQREIAERQLQAITEDQSRLHANLRKVPQTSPLHRRYLAQDMLAGGHGLHSSCREGQGAGGKGAGGRPARRERQGGTEGNAEQGGRNGGGGAVGERRRQGGAGQRQAAAGEPGP